MQVCHMNIIIDVIEKKEKTLNEKVNKEYNKQYLISPKNQEIAKATKKKAETFLKELEEVKSLLNKYDEIELVDTKTFEEYKNFGDSKYVSLFQGSYCKCNELTIETLTTESKKVLIIHIGRIPNY